MSAPDRPTGIQTRRIDKAGKRGGVDDRFVSRKRDYGGSEESRVADDRLPKAAKDVLTFDHGEWSKHRSRTKESRKKNAGQTRPKDGENILRGKKKAVLGDEEAAVVYSLWDYCVKHVETFKNVGLSDFSVNYKYLFSHERVQWVEANKDKKKGDVRKGYPLGKDFLRWVFTRPDVPLMFNTSGGGLYHPKIVKPVRDRFRDKYQIGWDEERIAAYEAAKLAQKLSEEEARVAKAAEEARKRADRERLAMEARERARAAKELEQLEAKRVKYAKLWAEKQAADLERKLDDLHKDTYFTRRGTVSWVAINKGLVDSDSESETSTDDYIDNTHVVHSSLNGNNGEATNTDDVKSKGERGEEFKEEAEVLAEYLEELSSMSDGSGSNTKPEGVTTAPMGSNGVDHGDAKYRKLYENRYAVFARNYDRNFDVYYRNGTNTEVVVDGVSITESDRVNLQGVTWSDFHVDFTESAVCNTSEPKIFGDHFKETRAVRILRRVCHEYDTRLCFCRPVHCFIPLRRADDGAGLRVYFEDEVELFEFKWDFVEKIYRDERYSLYIVRLDEPMFRYTGHREVFVDEEVDMRFAEVNGTVLSDRVKVQVLRPVFDAMCYYMNQTADMTISIRNYIVTRASAEHYVCSGNGWFADLREYVDNSFQAAFAYMCGKRVRTNQTVSVAKQTFLKDVEPKTDISRSYYATLIDDTYRYLSSVDVSDRLKRWQHTAGERAQECGVQAIRVFGWSCAFVQMCGLQASQIDLGYINLLTGGYFTWFYQGVVEEVQAEGTMLGSVAAEVTYWAVSPLAIVAFASFEEIAKRFLLQWMSVLVAGMLFSMFENQLAVMRVGKVTFGMSVFFIFRMLLHTFWLALPLEFAIFVHVLYNTSVAWLVPKRKIQANIFYEFVEWFFGGQLLDGNRGVKHIVGVDGNYHAVSEGKPSLTVVKAVATSYDGATGAVQFEQRVCTADTMDTMRRYYYTWYTGLMVPFKFLAMNVSNLESAVLRFTGACPVETVWAKLPEAKQKLVEMLGDFYVDRSVVQGHASKYEEVVAFVEEPHPKRKLREANLRYINDRIKLFNERIDKNQGKQKKELRSKPGKKARLFVKVGDNQIILYGHTFSLLKNCFASVMRFREVVPGNYVTFAYGWSTVDMCRSLDRAIELGGKHAWIFSDDVLVFDVRDGKPIHAWNIDIASCDQSHRPLSFDLLEYLSDLFQLDTDDVRKARADNFSNLSVLHPDGRREGYIEFAHSEEIGLCSGYAGTTIINSLMSCMCITDAMRGWSYETAFARYGFSITCEDGPFDQTAIFLKHRPYVSMAGYTWGPCMSILFAIGSTIQRYKTKKELRQHFNGVLSAYLHHPCAFVRNTVKSLYIQRMRNKYEPDFHWKVKMPFVYRDCDLMGIYHAYSDVMHLATFNMVVHLWAAHLRAGIGYTLVEPAVMSFYRKDYGFSTESAIYDFLGYHDACSTLNGVNGEATNTDDLEWFWRCFVRKFFTRFGALEPQLYPRLRAYATHWTIGFVFLILYLRFVQYCQVYVGMNVYFPHIMHCRLGGYLPERLVEMEGHRRMLRAGQAYDGDTIVCNSADPFHIYIDMPARKKNPPAPKHSGRKGLNTIGDIREGVGMVKDILGIFGSGKYTTEQRAVQSAIDKKAHKIASKKVRGSGAYTAFSGMGEYKNSLFSDSDSTVAAMSTVNSDIGATSITREEFVMNVYSPTTPAAFNNTSFNINPGLTVFPWLSQLAGNYRRYEFKQLIFKYVPAISSASTSGAMGTIIMAADYNSGSNKFESAQQMQEYAGSIVAPPYKQILCGIECDQRQLLSQAIFVRSGAVPSGQDIKTYDLCKFQVATDGLPAAIFPAGTLMGKLYVYYTVKLLIPQFYDGLGYSIYTDAFTGATGVTETLPLGTQPTKSSLNSIGGALQKAGTSVYTFPDNFTGYIQIDIVTSSTASLGNATFTLTGNITATGTAFIGLNAASVSAATSTTSTVSLSTLFYRVSQASVANGNTFAYSYANPGVITGSYLRVTFINSLNGIPYGAGSNWVSV